MKKFTKANFKTWLNKQYPNRRFSFRSQDECVFSCFGREVLGLDDCISTTYYLSQKVYYVNSNKDYYFKFPEWATIECDKMALKSGNFITVKQILKTYKP